MCDNQTASYVTIHIVLWAAILYGQLFFMGSYSFMDSYSFMGSYCFIIILYWLCGFQKTTANNLWLFENHTIMYIFHTQQEVCHHRGGT